MSLEWPPGLAHGPVYHERASTVVTEGVLSTMGMSPFVQGLRDKVGHDLLMLPSVSVLVTDSKERILLVRQADFGRWGTIGGAIEPGESPEEAAKRETLEEAGIDVELTELVGVFGGDGYEVTYPNGDKTSYVTVVYRATIVSGSPQPDQDETTEVGWFSPADLHTTELHSFAQRLFSDLGLR